MQAYTPSLLDKLLGAATLRRDERAAPSAAGQRADGSVPAAGSGMTPLLNVDQVMKSVKDDIENLLNTRRSYDAETLKAMPRSAESLLTLGLVDISSMSVASDKDRRRITDAIRDGLMAHDKRLSNVEVGVRPVADASGELTFTIRARLLLQPSAEHVAFDVVLQRGSNRYVVPEVNMRATPAP